jgi:hypothetical protein
MLKADSVDRQELGNILLASQVSLSVGIRPDLRVSEREIIGAAMARLFYYSTVF